MKWSSQSIREAMLLYAVTDRSWLAGRSLAEVVEQALQNGATFLQVREKGMPYGEFLGQSKELCALARRYRVPVVINDDVELALECGADGVHVGQSDIKGRDIRSLLGPDKILGITANTVETARAAEAAGADYIGVGAVFGTTTKKDARPLAHADLRAIVQAVEIPVVAIGGIQGSNIPQLHGSGVDGIAVVSAIFAQEDPGAATAHLLGLARDMVQSRG